MSTAHSNGDKVNKSKQLYAVRQTNVEEIGGEDLSGSGFENEISEPDFIEPESVSAGEDR
jgi:hypothetical protein